MTTQGLIVIPAIVCLLLGASSNAEAETVILDANDNVIRIENLEVILDQGGSMFFHVDFVNDTGFNIYGIPLEFPFNAEDTIAALIQVQNALNANDQVPTGASSVGTDQYFLGADEDPLTGLIGAVGGEYFSGDGAWDRCEPGCILGVAPLNPADTFTYADFTLVSDPDCTDDDDCDDDLFCNGTETCFEGQCQDGLQSCGEGQVCLETTDECVDSECTFDGDCDDGRFCNGTETCVEGQCQDDVPPCGEGDVCLEITDQCVGPECAVDEDCYDGRFCNGTETCVQGQCQDGVPPCGEGQICIEITDQCAEDDSDGDGVNNAADACPTSPAPGGVDGEGRPLGDVDFDCDVDFQDFAIVQVNMSGPE